MQHVYRGLQRFQKEVFGGKKRLFERLAGGQQPGTLFITCSDSRIDPCLLTQSDPGELFVLRNAGNLVPPYDPSPGAEAATIEFAVQGLKVRDVVVCGHSQCGAMNGLLNPDKTEQCPALRTWLSHAEAVRHVVRVQGPQRGNPQSLLDRAIEQNVLVQLDHLLTHPAVARAVEGGTLNLHGWVYQFETGKVLIYRPERGRFVAFDSLPQLASVT